MESKLSEYPFVALFTNNGFENGFKPLLAYSKQINHLPWLNTQNSDLILLCSYDLKNKFESLKSTNNSGYSINDFIAIKPDVFEFISHEKLEKLLLPTTHFQPKPITIQTRVNKNQYIDQVNALKKEIQLGNIYELNYCIEFFAENIELNPFEQFKQYNAIAKSPMSAYIKLNHLHILCGSPERFLKKDGTRLISQPIKGTRKRGPNDEELIKELQNDKKERAENVMIVDLVRNDLSKIASKGSVVVDELCKVYTFNTVHQSISTVSCTIEPNLSLESALKACFPMGSMTGAPKLRAMELIEKHETTKRQLYSGSLGYITSNNNFDLNVVIRTMIYDEKNKYLSFMVGSALTAYCDAEKEFEECLIKAHGILKSLNADFAK